MLVLTRKVDESIRIGDDVMITITQITDTNVRIAIQAPGHMNIARSEIDRTDRSNQLLQRRDNEGPDTGATP